MEINEALRQMLYWRGGHAELETVMHLEDLHLEQGNILVGDPMRLSKKPLRIALNWPQNLASVYLFWSRSGHIGAIELQWSEETPFEWHYLGDCKLRSGLMVVLDERALSLIEAHQTQIENEGLEEYVGYWEDLVEDQLEHRGQAQFGLWRPYAHKPNNALVCTPGYGDGPFPCFAGLGLDGEVLSLVIDTGVFGQGLEEDF